MFPLACNDVRDQRTKRLQNTHGSHDVDMFALFEAS